MAGFTGFVIAFIYTAGGVVCHQLPERSFFWAGHQWPVCARCSGLYLGVALGVAAWLGARSMRGPTGLAPRQVIRVLIVIAAPTAISWVTGILGWWDSTNLARAALALPLGVTVGAIVAAVAAKDLR